MTRRAEHHELTSPWRRRVLLGVLAACSCVGAVSCKTEYTSAVASTRTANAPPPGHSTPADEAATPPDLTPESDASPGPDGPPAVPPRAPWATTAAVIEEAPAPIGVSKDVERAARFAGLTLKKGSGADLDLRVSWSVEPTTSFDANQSIVRWKLTVTAIDDHHQTTVDTLRLHGSAAAPKQAAANVEAEHAARIDLSRRIDTFIRHVLTDH